MNGSALALRDRLHELLEGLVRRLPSERLARPVVHQVSNRVQGILIMHAQVRSLGQELAQQPIRVLATAPLPRAVRIAARNRAASPPK